MSPPYVFPDRTPGKYDATAKGEVWVVCGPVYTDGTGWLWGRTVRSDLKPGDIWVPIHLLHTVQIPEIAERAERRRGEACDHCGVPGNEESDRDEQCSVCGRGNDR